MADVRPFRALRPPQNLVEQVAAPPYDVLDTAEARRLATGNPISFVRISRPEVNLPPGTDPHAQTVHESGRDRLKQFVTEGVFRQDDAESYYVYRQTWQGRSQTGLVACVSVAEYVSGVIRIHEHTRPDKEHDRARHIDVVNAHDEPVFLMTPSDPAISARLDALTAGDPEYDFTADDGVRHTLWVVNSPAELRPLREAFDAVSRLYIADGHHRSAAARLVHRWRTERGDSSPESGDHLFLAVVFPADDLTILPYHRVVSDLGDHDETTFLSLVTDAFEVTAMPGPVEPEHRHEFGLYLPGRWFRLRARNTDAIDADPIAGLDVSVLQDRLLRPVLGITDPRTDPRLGFVGGIHGTTGLQRRVDSGDAAVAFSLFPTSVRDLLAVADAGEVMPPKSTWFEPKLRSGLFVHPIGLSARP